jgi:alkanesulfonate monooxygenase SsuD/methylene tetrahydromethanopterin reductase-like flavin-dependent oxidoreductase (luciferase family)
VKIGFKTAQAGIDWPTLVATWELGDTLPVFDSAWIFDHFVALGDRPGGSHEGLVTLAALAARTHRLEVGHLVLSNTYRHPVVTAKAAVSMDHLTNGRFVLGLGAGWHEGEHAMYGLRLPPIGERISMLESAVRVIRALWSSPRGVTLSAPPYELHDAVCEPPPLTPGGPPLLLGLQGRRGLRITAQYADAWNHTGSPDEFVAKLDALRRHCADLARDPDEIEVGVQITGRGGPAAQLELASRYVREGAEHVVLSLPEGSRGPDGLLALAKVVAEPLRDRFG